MSDSGSQKLYVPGLFDRAKEVPFDVVLDALGLMNQLQVKGDEIRGKCPLCGGERSFAANPVKGKCNCFRCRKGGDVVDFVAAHQKIEPKQAAAWLVSLLPAQDETEQQAEREDALSALALTPREVRLLHIIARAQARCVATMFTSSFARMVAELEDMATEIVRDEIAKEFPDTAFSVERE